MRTATIWRKLLGVDPDTVIEHLEMQGGALLAHVRPRQRVRLRCPHCEQICPRYDQGGGERRWRTLDLGTVMAFLVGPAIRVRCPEHGVVVAAVAWARHGARFTRAFDDQVAWLANGASKSTVCELMRISWRTVGRIISRVSAEFDEEATFDRLRRIGIDEISHRKGQRYLVVVTDHDTKQVVWAAPGRSKETVEAFFDRLGPERCARIEVVTADGASWIRGPVMARCPEAKLCLDPFHVVQWATDALDSVRRETWNAARRAGQKAVADELKGARFALWKNPEDLTANQKRRLADIRKSNRGLYLAYLLKEQLRRVFRLDAERALRLLDHWLRWARRSRLKPFVKLAETITRWKEELRASLRLRASNGLAESVNTRIRLILRRAFGFHTAEAAIALVMLGLGGRCPSLPGERSVSLPWR